MNFLKGGEGTEYVNYWRGERAWLWKGWTGRRQGEGRRAWDEPCEGVQTFLGTPTSHMKVWSLGDKRACSRRRRILFVELSRMDWSEGSRIPRDRSAARKLLQWRARSRYVWLLLRCWTLPMLCCGFKANCLVLVHCSQARWPGASNLNSQCLCFLVLTQGWSLYFTRLSRWREIVHWNLLKHILLFI